jgi:tetratricopeptide (TPR) repeat protein
MEDRNPYAIIGLGHLYYDFKEYRDALFYWEKMLESSSAEVDIRVLTSIGNCHRKLKTFPEGIVYFEKALARDPHNFYALFGLADCYRGMNQQGRSLDYWNRILEQDPRNKVILTRAGDAYRNLGDYPRAVDYYERALNIEFDTYAVLGLAMVGKAQGKYEEASSSLRRLIQQDPRNYRLYLELADCRVKKGDRRGAAEALEEFQKQGIRSVQVNEFLEKIRG